MLNTILLQSMNSSWANILMIVALIAVFYFMMIRPQQKRQNEIKKFREGLKVGDAVVTAGGIYGKVKGIDDTTFTIEIARDVRITVDKDRYILQLSRLQMTLLKRVSKDDR